MNNRRRFAILIAALFSTLLTISPIAFFSTLAAPQTSGQGDAQKDDPCDQLPDPPGKAKGIDKKCPPIGSSSGIAKGDFNGDGVADLAIGVPDENFGSIVDAGAVNVVYGSAAGLTATSANVPTPKLLSLSVLGLGSAASGDRFGAALASGDFNGDGFSDLAIGIPNRSVTTSFFGINTVHPEAGAVAVVYGSANGLTTADPASPKPQYFDLIILSPSGFFQLDDSHFGQALAWGNFNGDKSNGNDIGDLAVGAPRSNFVGIFGENPRPDEGAVFVLFGTTSRGLRAETNFSIRQLDVTQRPDDGNGFLFGSAMAGLDVNGDGMTDLAVGAPGQTAGLFVNKRCVQDCHPEAGAIYLIPGISTGIDVFNAQMFTQKDISGQPADRDHFGASLAGGDFNGDGKADIAIGAPNRNIGSAADAGIVDVLYAFNARPPKIWALDAIGDVDEANAQFGKTLAAGDFNSDGKTDLAIGTPLRDVSGVADTGQVNIIFGSDTGLSLARVPQGFSLFTTGMATAPEVGDQFGASLTAWNFGRNVELGPAGIIFNQAADLAIGVPFKDVDSVSNAGAVIVLYGSRLSNGLTTSSNQLWTQNTPGMPCCSEARDHFGAAVY